jgi:hypothetical protein
MLQHHPQGLLKTHACVEWFDGHLPAEGWRREQEASAIPFEDGPYVKPLLDHL